MRPEKKLPFWGIQPNKDQPINEEIVIDNNWRNSIKKKVFQSRIMMYRDIELS